ncbi:MAG TPA: hypothetical protein PJ998_04505 [Terrimesophilobacter sp.]|nr:hypothetical protein [Terrimesophilobacter sp.]
MAENFDPRFDARFQPGFEQKAETHAPRPPAPVAGARDRAAHDEAAHGTMAPEDLAPEEAEPAEVGPDPNPFERTLWVFAAVLIVGGVAVAFWANGLNYSQSAIDGGWTWPRILQSSGWALSGPMVTVGLATGVGLLFRRAMSWSPPE